ncbi:MAG: 50S ribosomal protein L32e [Candidatus Woesearchaeota archaeon]|nr:50S ribosomal protein L32e [Candidatus Woesearchaeota archaeon]
MKKLLALRKKQKSKKPHFLREDSHKIMALPTGWRKPNGLHSKMRHNYRGQPAMVEPGWGSPRLVKGLWSNGLAPIIVHNATEIEKLNPSTQGVVIAADVGMKKRLVLIAKAQEKKISILNIKKVQEYIKAAQKQKSSTQKTKETAQPTLTAKIETAEPKDKQAEKEELDKLLTKRTT